MEKSWYWKVTFVVILLVGSVLYLLPTFVPGGRCELSKCSNNPERTCSVDNECSALPAWYTKVFSKRVTLGLDLQGGIHLVLGVDLDKALEDKADQYITDFRDTLKEKHIPFKRIARLPDSWDIQFELQSADDVDRLKKRILDEYPNLTRVDADSSDPTVVRVTYREDYVKKLRTESRDQCKMTIKKRVDEFEVAMPEVKPHGEDGILVQLPGMFDPERAKKLLGRTAQLEFKIVDDKSSFIKDLKDFLPADIRMDYYTYNGPNDEPVTETYLVAKGKGNEGKNLILNFLNNVSEIESFLKEKAVAPAIGEQLVRLIKDGVSESERLEITKLAREAFGVTGPAGPAAAAPKPEAAAAAEPAQEAAAEPARTAAFAPAQENLAAFEKLLRGKVPEDHEIAFERSERDLETEYRTYYLWKTIELTGDYITDATVNNDEETGQPNVNLRFDRLGAKKFEKVTGAHVRERMAIVIEGDVNSAPVIQTRIAGGDARITLGSSQDYNAALTEAGDLAAVLRSGALPAPVRILEERTVGPSMGEDARRLGTLAMIIGMVLVLVFMVFYYKVSGLVADLALVFNAILILVVMTALEATLTLPGIAGIVLTLGMAVDANVIINERIREEVRAGKTPRAAVDTGYSRAFWTIFDANLTTIITVVVLWSYGSGPIQGFAKVTFFGLIASMFTAIYVTRIVMDYLTIRLKVDRLSV